MEQKLSSEATDSLYAIAYELYRNGKYDAARHFFHYLALKDPMDRRCLIALAACHQMLKEYKLAIEYYSIAAIQKPEDPYAHWYAAECFHSLGVVKEAFEALESARIVAEKSPEYASLIPQIKMMSDAWRA